jgi:N-acetylmuramoyl-L-alanine amidase
MSILSQRNLILSTVIILTFFFALNTRADNPDELFRNAKKNLEQLNSSPKLKKNRSNWLAVIRQFEKIAQDSPGSPEAPKSLYHAGNLYTRISERSHSKKDLKSALSVFENLGGNYSQDPLADDAWFHAAEIYRTRLNNPEQAYVLYNKILTQYTEGDMALKARYWATRLEIKLASKPANKPPAKNSAPAKAPPELDIKNPVTVQAIRHWSGPEYTRVVVDLSDRANYRRHLLRSDPENKKPPRLFLDVYPARISPELKDPIIISDGLLNRARASQYRKNVVRIVLDINSFEKDTVFQMENPFRLVMDIEGKAETAPQAVTAAAQPEGQTIENIIADSMTKAVEPEPKIKPEPAAPVAPIAPVAPSAPTLAKQLGLKIRKIVLDPGHGGKDPGAIGPSGLQEKNINLKVARYLRDLLEAQQYKVKMTRDSDVFVDLAGRNVVANIAKADLFISIHTNASPKRETAGIETYYLGTTRNPETMRLAAQENSTSPRGLSDIEGILQDLLLSSKIEESNIFAGSVLRKMIQGVKELNPGVESHGSKPAPFYVLVHARMPAILVEVSYISNPREENLLRQEDYLKTLARAIADGIDEYEKGYLSAANW